MFLLKGNFSGLFFFRTSRDEGEFPRGYLINTAACLFACHYNRHQVVDKNLSTLSKSQYQRKQSLLQCFTLDTLLLFAGMVGRVSTNNVQITYSDQIYKALQKKPSNIMFLTKKRSRQMPINQQLLYQTDKTSHRRRPVTKAVCKHFAMFSRKHLC